MNTCVYRCCLIVVVYVFCLCCCCCCSKSNAHGVCYRYLENNNSVISPVQLIHLIIHNYFKLIDLFVPLHHHQTTFIRVVSFVFVIAFDWVCLCLFCFIIISKHWTCCCLLVFTSSSNKWIRFGLSLSRNCTCVLPLLQDNEHARLTVNSDSCTCFPFVLFDFVCEWVGLLIVISKKEQCATITSTHWTRFVPSLRQSSWTCLFSR